MISIYSNVNLKTRGERDYSTFELRGLSTDEKPTEIGGKKVDNGSIFVEIDTGKIFFYDLESEEWKGE